ncbi:hypothetical protein UF75_5030 [Desulfosporosinus sp. I2]|nr:hypothetical protein UF75_5030 [Desulfosporosinus sp. I2]
MILLGGKQVSYVTIIAMLLIIMGAVIGSLDLLRPLEENRENIKVTMEEG